MSTTRTTLVKCRSLACQHIGEPLKTVDTLRTALGDRFCEECHSDDVEPYFECVCCHKAPAEQGSDFCTPCADALDSTMPAAVAAAKAFKAVEEIL